jgi:hypothetical protein
VARGLTVRGGGFGCAGASAMDGMEIAMILGQLDEVARLLGEEPGLLEAKDAQGRTPCSASETGKVEVVRWLLDYGAAITERGVHGDTVLTLACRLDNIPLVKLLVERGADTTISGVIGTPLMTASIEGHSEIVRFLLEHPSAKNTINHTNVVGATALHKACQWGRGACVTALLESGADLMIANICGMTPEAAAKQPIDECLRVVGVTPEGRRECVAALEVRSHSLPLSHQPIF